MQDGKNKSAGNSGQAHGAKGRKESNAKAVGEAAGGDGISQNAEIAGVTAIDLKDTEAETPMSANLDLDRADAAATEAGANESRRADKPGAKVWAYIKGMPKRYFIDAFSGMAMGLFCTLIAGTIITQLGKLIGGIEVGFFQAIGAALQTVGSIASLLMGAGIGVGIAKALKASNLVIFSAAVAGMIGAASQPLMDGIWISAGAVAAKPGNPVGAYVTALIGVELGRLVAGKTPLDIILVPLTVIFTAMLCIYVAYPFIKLVELIGKGIELATAATPFVMGVVIAVSMGLLLTLPTSSAAIWVSIATSTSPSTAMLLAGGAAVCGCAAHMVGFAVQSFRENRFGGLIAQGLGTSMLQIPNLMRKPKILLPPIIASAIVGPLSTCVFKLSCNASGGGMGTAGLVGVFGVLETSVNIPAWQMWLGIILLMFVIPAAVCWGLSELMRKKKWIAFGDMKLDLK